MVPSHSPISTNQRPELEPLEERYYPAHFVLVFPDPVAQNPIATYSVRRCGDAGLAALQGFDRDDAMTDEQYERCCRAAAFLLYTIDQVRSDITAAP